MEVGPAPSAVGEDSWRSSRSRKRHPTAKVKGGWTPQEDELLTRWEDGGGPQRGRHLPLYVRARTGGCVVQRVVGLRALGCAGNREALDWG